MRREGGANMKAIAGRLVLALSFVPPFAATRAIGRLFFHFAMDGEFESLGKEQLQHGFAGRLAWPAVEALR